MAHLGCLALEFINRLFFLVVFRVTLVWAKRRSLGEFFRAPMSIECDVCHHVFDGSLGEDGHIPGHLNLLGKGFLMPGCDKWARSTIERNGFLVGTCRYGGVCLRHLSLSGVGEMTVRTAPGAPGDGVAATGIQEVCLHRDPLFWGLGDLSFPNYEV